MKLNIQNMRRGAMIAALAALSAAGLMACEPAENTEVNTEAQAEQPMAEAESQVPAPTEEPTAAAPSEAEPSMGEPAGEQGAMAQGQQAPPTQAPPGMMQGEIDDEQVKAFAQAYVATQPVQAEVQQKMAGVQSPEEAQKVQQEAITQIQSAVEEAGMAFEEYAMFAQRLQQDTALQQRFEAELQQVQN